MTDDRLAALERFVADDPADPFNHYALGLEFLGRRDYEKAIAKFSDTLKCDSRYAAAWHQLGMLYAELGRTGEAVKALEEGIRVSRDAGDAHASAEMRDLLDQLEQ